MGPFSFILSKESINIIILLFFFFLFLQVVNKKTPPLTNGEIKETSVTTSIKEKQEQDKNKEESDNPDKNDTDTEKGSSDDAPNAAKEEDKSENCKVSNNNCVGDNSTPSEESVSVDTVNDNHLDKVTPPNSSDSDGYDSKVKNADGKVEAKDKDDSIDKQKCSELGKGEFNVIIWLGTYEEIEIGNGN